MGVLLIVCNVGLRGTYPTIISSTAYFGRLPFIAEIAMYDKQRFLDGSIISQCYNHIMVKTRDTTARKAILDILTHSHEPKTVKDLIAKLSYQAIEVDRTTVFRIMNAFTDRGIVRKLEFTEGNFRYELLSLPHHYHIVCTRCATIQDVQGCDVNAIEKETARKYKFVITHHRLDFFGLCEKCASLPS